MDVKDCPLIILAGGKSSRMGEPKGLVLVQGRSWLELQLEAFARAGGSRAILVLGYDAAKYFEALPWLGDGSRFGIGLKVVVNEAPELGPFSSLRMGLDSLRSEAAFALPVDVPCAEETVWKILCVSMREGVQACMPVFEGRGGHPVLLSSQFIDHLKKVDLRLPDARLDRQILLLQFDRIVRVEVKDPMVCLNLNAPKDFKNLGLMRSQANHNDLSSVDLNGRDAATLAAVEVGLGSLLHGLRIPLGGHLLSLNQGFLLSRTVLKSDRRGLGSARTAGFKVSSIAAVLKSLSPAGKRLTPMLALSMQGLLFTIGTLLAGPNWVGVAIGSALASVWAFVQPVLIYYVLYGQVLEVVVRGIYEKLREVIAFESQHLLWVLSAVLIVKALVSVVLAGVAAWLPDKQWARYQERLIQGGPSIRKRTSSILHDVFNPLFVFSLVLTGLFFFFSDAKTSTLIWALLRPVAVGFVIFYLIRVISFESLIARVERCGFTGFARSFRVAIQALQRSQ